MEISEPEKKRLLTMGISDLNTIEVRQLLQKYEIPWVVLKQRRDIVKGQAADAADVNRDEESKKTESASDTVIEDASYEPSSSGNEERQLVLRGPLPLQTTSKKKPDQASLRTLPDRGRAARSDRSVREWRPDLWTKRVMAVLVDNILLINIYATNDHDEREKLFTTMKNWPWPSHGKILAANLPRRLKIEDVHILARHADDDDAINPTD
ncbi:hypothetical protein PI126_g17653 [Phytophthora idaei]|nr:hypothetical protein PI126_g17653 [Phytophthora idaei]